MIKKKIPNFFKDLFSVQCEITLKSEKPLSTLPLRPTHLQKSVFDHNKTGRNRHYIILR